MSVQNLQPMASFVRPADVLAYTVGDLVANSTTAGSVVPMSFEGPSQGASFIVRRIRVRKTSTTVGGQFRVHLFRTLPTMTVGDNAAIVLPGNGSNYLGSVDVTTDQAFASGAVGFGALATDSHIRLSPNDGEFIYAVLEARSAYTPGNAETFEVQLQLRTS